MTSALMKEIAGQDGIVGVHFVCGIDGQANTTTAESKLREQPDARCEWILLIEAVEGGFVAALRAGPCSDEALRRLSSDATIERGIYRFQYDLSRTEQ